MERKFLKIIENTISRYSNGGFMTGDIVQLVGNYKSKDSYKSLPDDVKAYIDDYFKTDMNYRVVNIKTAQATGGGAGPADNANRGAEFNVEVALDYGGGRYDNQGKVTVNANLLKRASDDNGAVGNPPVPNGIRYDNKEQIKPRELNDEDEIEYTRQTSQGNLGDAAKDTELSLPTSNTKIPSKSVTSSPAVGDTRAYMG
mgnify:FL=1|jgi:hypothetical protein|tara:strand:- start:630 stop:1229 length:600 start_codon:yes stop_codon:yes gene_type:complete